MGALEAMVLVAAATIVALVGAALANERTRSDKQSE
jgi:hypothetical protein